MIREFVDCIKSEFEKYNYRLSFIHDKTYLVRKPTDAIIVGKIIFKDGCLRCCFVRHGLFSDSYDIAYEDLRIGDIVSSYTAIYD